MTLPSYPQCSGALAPFNLVVDVLTTFPGCENLDDHFGLSWDGTKWSGTTNNPSNNWTMQMHPLPNEAFRLTWSYAGCDSGEDFGSADVCTFQVLFSPHVHTGCCSNPPSFPTIAPNIAIQGGFPHAAATPPWVRPACPPTTPNGPCCPRPGVVPPNRVGQGNSSGQSPGIIPRRLFGGGSAPVSSFWAGGTGGVKSSPLAGGGSKGQCCPPSTRRPGSGGGSGAGGGSCGSGFCSPPYSTHPVRYATGELSLSADDIATDGFGVPWGHTRSFASRLSHNEMLGNGANWQIQQWPYLVRDPANSRVVIQGRANTYLWFDESEGQFTSSFHGKETLVHDAAAHVYRLHELDGSYLELSDSTGMFRRHVDPAGNQVQVKTLHSNGFNFTEVERSYTSGGTTTTEQFFYEYDTSDLTTKQLVRVTLRRKVGAGAWQNISRASYTYYGNDEQHGEAGDLKTATTEAWENTAWQATGTSLYRYYKSLSAGGSSSSSSSSSGSEFNYLEARLLKYVVNPGSYERLKDDPNVTDPLTASDLVVSLYADYYFEYDALRRVTKERVQGGSRTFTFSYAESAFADDYNHWKTKTVETLPSGAQNLVYSNYAGQTMLHVFKSGSDEWLEFSQYNSEGQVILQANPSALSGYDEQHADLLHAQSGNYEYLKDHDGLIRTFEYHPLCGYLTAEKIQKGELGDSIKLREYEYLSCGDLGASSSSSSSSSSSGASTPAAWFLSKEIAYPSDTDQTKKIITSYAYTFHPGTCQVKERVTTLPAIPVEQNGSGVAATRREVFDLYGNPTWQMDERGFLTRAAYDVPTGGLKQFIQDVDTSQTTDEPAGWETPTGGGLHLTTDFEHDDLGRMTQSLGPIHSVDLGGTATNVRCALWIVYKDSDHEILAGQGYASGAEYNSYTLINPVSITRFDRNGQKLEVIQAARSSTSGKLQASDSFPQSLYVRWSTHQYTDCCFLTSTRVYHTIPTTGEGESGTHYDQTNFGYDSSKRQNRHVTPGGTITRTIFDVRDNPIAIYVGTNDTGATASDPTGGGASGNNMVVVTENEYDGEIAGRDNNLTKQTQHVDGSTVRETLFIYDWRNRQQDIDGEEDFYQRSYFDNLDRIWRVEHFDTLAPSEGSGSSNSSSGSTVGNLIARNDTLYDDLSRVYQTKRYAVNVQTGVVGNVLTDNTWHDATGQVIKNLPSGAKLFAKLVYDGAGRQTKEFRGFDIDESAYSEASSISDDTIMEQSEFAYDAASNSILATLRHRYHNATGTAELQNPGGAEPKARVTYVATWHDAIGRIIARADYGTNGGSTLTRPGTIPTRSDTVLVTSTTHDSAGEVSSITNPRGLDTCFEYDAAGRKLKEVLNCVHTSSSSSSSSSSGAPESDDRNVTVLTAYNADGNISSLTAVNSFTGDQTTLYIYGTTLSDSSIASSLLKRAEIYPDSDDSADPLSNGADGVYDRIEFKYNRQSDLAEMKDQNETVHAYDFDKLGRQTHDRVTTLGSGVDGAVRRISTTYEPRGMREKITSYDNATVGSGSVVNEVQLAYNDFGQITADYQAHDGAVNTATTPKVQYAYANGSANTIRATTLTYPSGRVLTYDYGSSGSTNDVLSRIGGIVDDDAGSTHLADYAYLGLSAVVEVDYTEPNVKYTLIGTAGGNDPNTGDIYRGFDRFGRAKDSYWRDYLGGSDVDRIKYGYDRNGNRIWRENTVAASFGKHFDELYTYDAVDRLQAMARGELNASKDAVSSRQFAQEWTLDATGNWRNFREDTDGSGSWDLDQQRFFNRANEVADVSETTGAIWSIPAYDRTGNVTAFPNPEDLTQSLAAVFDSWNRLVGIASGAESVAQYEYDGVRRRIKRNTYASGMLSESRQLYFTQPSLWQVIEERVGASTDPNRQFVWGVRYMDDLVARDHDTDSNGVSDERLYCLQDSNWNATTLIEVGGLVAERYCYDVRGVATVFNDMFDARSMSAYNWETRFAGYRQDVIGFCQVRNRDLHMELGSWMQRDPIEYEGDFQNLLRYVFNSPVSFTDGLGLELGCCPETVPPVVPRPSLKPSPRLAPKPWLPPGWKPIGYIPLPWWVDCVIVTTPRYEELEEQRRRRRRKRKTCFCYTQGTPSDPDWFNWYKYGYCTTHKECNQRCLEKGYKYGRCNK